MKSTVFLTLFQFLVSKIQFAYVEIFDFLNFTRKFLSSCSEEGGKFMDWGAFSVLRADIQKKNTHTKMERQVWVCHAPDLEGKLRIRSEAWLY